MLLRFRRCLQLSRKHTHPRFFSLEGEEGASHGPGTSHEPYATYHWLGRKNYEANHKRKLAANGGKGVYVGKIIELPTFIQSIDLAKKLKITLMKFSKIGRQVFSWWPQDSEKEMRKNGFENVKPLILTYEEAARIVRAQHQQAVQQNLDGTDLEPSEPDIRPKMPVVTILGHVDHGKTTLLDTLRNAKVAQSEPGLITQDTYAFQVDLGNEMIATFLDTPGHQNFFNMRSNGVFFSDLVLLVVAADEGIQAQTLESLRIAKEHSVPICAVITKTDSQKARVEKVKAQLREEGLDLVDPTVELTKQDIQKGRCYVIPISALKGTNMTLMTTTLARALGKLNLTADEAAVPEGAVVEAFKEPGGRGNVARLILRHGTLTLRDHFVCGLTHGRVRGIKDETGAALEFVTPGIAFELWGCEAIPSVGDDFFTGSKEHVADVSRARFMEFEYPFQPRILAANNGLTPDDELSDWEEGALPPTVHTKYSLLEPVAPIEDDSGSEDDGSHYYNNPQTTAVAAPVRPRTQQEAFEVVVKTNNVGSLRMLLDSFHRFNKLHASVLIRALRPSTGRVTMDDIMRASSTPSRTVFCLRTGPFGPQAVKRAEDHGVTIARFDVFHELLDAVFEPFFAGNESEEEVTTVKQEA